MDYWKRRDLKERVRLFDLTEQDIQRILGSAYRKVYKDVKARLADLINSLPPDATADMLYREDKLYKLLNELQAKIDHLGQLEKSHMEKTFTNYYIANAQQDATFTLPIDNERVFRAVNDVWCGDGKNFSDRIWTDKRRLIDNLKSGLIDTVATGNNWGEFSKKLKNDFNTSYFNSQRLVRTELSHIQNESSLYKYEVEGVKQVRFVAESDNRTCEECSKYDGMVFPIDKAPKIPLHPVCRCTYIPVIEIGGK